MSQFNLFEVTDSTTLDDIIKQYKELAKKYHPDTQTKDSSKEKFQELQSEYTKVIGHLKRVDFEKASLEKDKHINELIDVFISKFVTNPQYQPLATEGLKLFVQIIK